MFGASQIIPDRKAGAMLLITFKAIIGTQIVYSLAGDIRAIHLARLDQLLSQAIVRDMTVCFDMAAVLSLDAGAFRFFTEGPGRTAAIEAPPQALDSGRNDVASHDSGGG